MLRLTQTKLWIQQKKKKLKQFLGSSRFAKRYVFLLAMAYLVSFVYLMSRFPPFVREEVIASVAGALLTVEGVLIGLSFQIRIRWIRDFVAVGSSCNTSFRIHPYQSNLRISAVGLSVHL